MSYAIAGGERYNMVLTHSRKPDEFKEPSSDEVLAEMREVYSGWDPRSVTIAHSS
jgi:hypothetical protein